MDQENIEKPWSICAIGDATPEERAAFYDDLAGDETEDNFAIFGEGNEKFYNNPRLEVAIIAADGRLVPASAYPRPGKLKAKAINIFLERYFVHAVPGRFFDIQMSISARHDFTTQARERVSHTMAVKGVMGDYVNYLSEPVFKGLIFSEMLALDVAITFVTDRATERLLSVLKSPDLQKGVQLAATYNPIFGTAATYVRGLVETIANARKNRAITDAHVGLMAEPGEVSLPLVEGTYVLFQPLTKSEDIMSQNPRLAAGMSRIITDTGTFDRNHLILRIQAAN